VYPAEVAVPASAADFPYVYPPPTLPLFGLLAALPRPIVEAAWLAGLAAAVVLAARELRLPGVSSDARPGAISGSFRRSSRAGAVLLWPAAFSGLWVGNVAIFLFLLYALGRRRPAAMVPAGAVKVGQAVGVLWLVRDRRWRSLAVGTALVAAIAAATLPIVGLERWQEWLRGLDVYRQQAQQFGGPLAGEGIPAFVPVPLWLILVAVMLVIALRPAGDEGHARVGVAAVVASPTVHSHGFLTALPAFAALPPPRFWVALGITSTPAFSTWWAAVALVVATWLMASRRSPDRPAASRGAVGPSGLPRIEPARSTEPSAREPIDA
jgi:hypothetical protein